MSAQDYEPGYDGGYGPDDCEHYTNDGEVCVDDREDDIDINAWVGEVETNAPLVTAQMENKQYSENGETFIVFRFSCGDKQMEVLVKEAQVITENDGKFVPMPFLAAHSDLNWKWLTSS